LNSDSLLLVCAEPLAPLIVFFFILADSFSCLSVNHKSLKENKLNIKEWLVE